MNVYSYCGNNPVNSVDPSGLSYYDFAKWIDDNVMGGQTERLGRAMGCYDAGNGSLGAVIWEGGKWLLGAVIVATSIVDGANIVGNIAKGLGESGSEAILDGTINGVGNNSESVAGIEEASSESTSSVGEFEDYADDPDNEPHPPIRNSHLAGKTHSVTGVPFDEEGFPVFNAEAEIDIDYTGTRYRDFKAAREAAGYSETPEGFTWHHHQNGRTMQLVDKQIHRLTGHTGGFSLHPVQ